MALTQGKGKYLICLQKKTTLSPSMFLETKSSFFGDTFFLETFSNFSFPRVFSLGYVTFTISYRTAVQTFLKIGHIYYILQTKLPTNYMVWSRLLGEIFCMAYLPTNPLFNQLFLFILGTTRDSWNTPILLDIPQVAEPNSLFRLFEPWQ